MVKIFKSPDENYLNEVSKLVKHVEGAANLAFLAVSLENDSLRRYREIGNDFSNGIKKSGYLKNVENLDFEENICNYFNNFKKYVDMDWNQKPIKRSSFNYRPGDILKKKRK